MGTIYLEFELDMSSAETKMKRFQDELRKIGKQKIDFEIGNAKLPNFGSIKSPKFTPEVDLTAFNKALEGLPSMARDTLAEIDRQKVIVFNTKIVGLQETIQQAKQALKDPELTRERQVELKIGINRLSSELTEAKRQLQNYINTGDESLSRLQRKFNGIGDTIRGIGAGSPLAGFFGSLGSGISGIGTKIDGLIGGFQRVGTTLGALGLISGIGFGLSQIGGYMTDATAKARTFEKGMSSINTVINTTSSNLSKLGDDITKLSNTYGVATQSIQGLVFEIASAGNTLENIPALTELALRGAIASGESATDIFKGVNAVIKGYGLDISEATTILDKFFKANIQGQLTVGDLAREIQGVTGSARTLGVSVNELLAGFTLYTGQIGTVSETSTALARTFDALSSPSAQAINTLKEFGISYQQIQETIAKPIDQGGGYLNTLKMITDALGGNNLALGKVFDNTNAYKLAMAVAGTEATKLSEHINGISNSLGATDQALAQMTDDTDFKLRVTAQRWENFKISVGRSILGIIQRGFNLANTISQAFGIVESAIGIMASGFAFLFQAGTKLFSQLGKNIRNIGSYIADTLSTAGHNAKARFMNGIGGGLAQGVAGIFNTVLSAIEGFVNKSISAVNSLIGSLNKIPGVNIGKVGTISLPRISAPGSTKIMLQGYKDVPSLFEGISMSANKNLSSVKQFNKSLASLKSGISGFGEINDGLEKKVFGDIQAEKENALKTLLEEDRKRKEEEDRKRGSGSGGSGGGSGGSGGSKESPLEGEKKIITDLQTSAKNLIETINKSITDTSNKIVENIKKIEDIDKKIKDINLSTQDKLSSRFVELSDQIQSLNADISNGNLQGTELENKQSQVAKLQEELELIKQNTTEQERAEAVRVAGLSTTQKILEDKAKQIELLEKEKTTIENNTISLQEELKKQTLQQEGALKTRDLLERQYEQNSLNRILNLTTKWEELGNAMDRAIKLNNQQTNPGEVRTSDNRVINIQQTINNTSDQEDALERLRLLLGPNF